MHWIKGFTMRSIIILFLMTFAACAVQIEYVTIETIGLHRLEKMQEWMLLVKQLGK